MSGASDPVERAARDRLHRLAGPRAGAASSAAGRVGAPAGSGEFGWVPAAPNSGTDDGASERRFSHDEVFDDDLSDDELLDGDLSGDEPLDDDFLDELPELGFPDRAADETEVLDRRPPAPAPRRPIDDLSDHEEPGGRPNDADDIRDVVARMRAGALDTAATAYTATHGHPLEHPHPGVDSGRRWHLSVRLAVVAGIAIALLGGGVAVRAMIATSPAMPVSSVPTPVGPSAAGSTALDPARDAAAPSSGPEAPGSGAGKAGSVPAGTSSGTTGTTGTSGAASGVGAPAVVVHVVGKVTKPGVIELPAGSRVADALAAAGGAASGADLAAVNLARVVIDGEQIVVPAPGQPAASGSGAGSVPAVEKDPLVDLNTADLAALDELPGIGPVLAQRVLDWRDVHGRFTDVAELGEVAGIGDKVLGQLRDLVTV